MAHNGLHFHDTSRKMPHFFIYSIFIRCDLGVSRSYSLLHRSLDNMTGKGGLASLWKELERQVCGLGWWSASWIHGWRCPLNQEGSSRKCRYPTKSEGTISTVCSTSGYFYYEWNWSEHPWTGFCVNLFLSLWGKCTRVHLQSLLGIACLALGDLACFSVHFTSPPAMYEWLSVFISSAEFGMVTIFHIALIDV